MTPMMAGLFVENTCPFVKDALRKEIMLKDRASRKDVFHEQVDSLYRPWLDDELFGFFQHA